MAFGQLVFDYRKKKGLNQTQLGAETDMDQGSVSEIEKGHRLPRQDVAERFIKKLGIPRRLAHSQYGRAAAARAGLYLTERDKRELRADQDEDERERRNRDKNDT